DGNYELLRERILAPFQSQAAIARLGGREDEACPLDAVVARLDGTLADAAPLVRDLEARHPLAARCPVAHAAGFSDARLRQVLEDFGHGPGDAPTNTQQIVAGAYVRFLITTRCQTIAALEPVCADVDGFIAW